MKTAQQIVSEGLTARGVPVLLIGGMALPAFDVIRQTIDLDCLMVDSQAGEIHAVLVEADYEEQERTENFVRYSHPSVYLSEVDVVLVSQETFDKMLGRSRPLDVGNAVMRVPCAAHLVMLKLHAMKNNPKREVRDLSDIVEILRNKPDTIAQDELQAMCRQYGPANVYEKLKEAL